LLDACGGGGGGGSSTPPPPPDPSQFRASALSPFAAGCDGTPVTGTLYINAEVEPYVAVNPRNAANLIGVWQQDRWSNGGARGVLTGVSVDGGQTWTQRMAAFSRCTGGNAANGGDYARVSDPWVTIAPDGTAYQIVIAFNGDVLAAGSSSAVLVSRSTDNGNTWGAPVALISDGSDFFNDKESITADPADARLVYAVWDRLTALGDAPTYFTRTTDGGISWEAPSAVFDPGAPNQTINNQLVVLPDGTLVIFFTRLDVTPTRGTAATLVVIRSLDKGVTWSVPITVSPVQAVGARDPETHVAIRDALNLGSIAVGPHGELVAVWQDSRFSGGLRDAIAVSRSVDGGLTWSTPARINADPAVQAFLPSVAIRSDGTIGVLYYDLRNNTADPATLPTDIWLARSTDAITWLESHVSGPFNFAIAPNSLGLFVGDYASLVSIGSEFVPFYAQTNDGDTANRTDVFASLVTTAGTARKDASVAIEEAVAPMRAESAAPLPLTPELSQQLTDSVVRTMQRRVPGWTPRGVIRPPAPNAP
jgi:BNR repeat-like domain